MRAPITALALMASLLTACPESGEPPTGTIKAEPATVTAKTTDPPFDVTVTTTSKDATGAEITITESTKGIVTQGTVTPSTGAENLSASGNSYSYVASDTDVTKIAFTCTNPGETTFTFNVTFTNSEHTTKVGPATVKITCTGPTQTDLLTAFFQLLGVPKTVAWVAARVKNMIEHSTGTIAAVKAQPDLIAKAAVLVMMTQVIVTATFGNTTLPCGQGKDAYTVCPTDKKPFPPGETILVMHQMDQPVELNDSKYSWTYGFVFDQDGDSTNNYQPGTQYPKDFYKDTDRWYEALYAPGKGWSLKVTDASGGAITPFPSAARIVLYKEMAALVVPASELKVKDPKFRTTIFRHTGDYGMNPPHDWSGDMEPPVDKGLQTFK